MSSQLKFTMIMAGAISLCACSTLPTQPSMLVLPGSNKSFEQFRADDYNCRYFAYGQIGGIAPSQVANAHAAENALLTTAVGAALGAVVGGGEGAAVGAGTGLLLGSLLSIDDTSLSDAYAQDRYDISYIQCMYAQGHKVPVSGQFMGGYSSGNNAPANIPSPPAGSPPPPPLR